MNYYLLHVRVVSCRYLIRLAAKSDPGEGSFQLQNVVLLVRSSSPFFDFYRQYPANKSTPDVSRIWDTSKEILFQVRAGSTELVISSSRDNRWQQLSRAGATPEMLMCRKQNKRALRKMTYVLGIGQQSMPETIDRKTTKSEADTKM
ncbi:hypothetical protein PGT21_001116 [Puccinia graminis f. sp. tritici]|uniref:Uncharacterized protein n=1 Tax=Puccinia graminis f. sp. tritici TaxID=56615 RepID=A0A5B0MLT9_PUCGR|nr:hypothetical protein PGT21_001116 [Puccinia graminis f. sp. tritici]